MDTAPRPALAASRRLPRRSVRHGAGDRGDPRLSAPLRFETRPVTLRLRHPWTTARNTSAAKTNVLTRLTAGGITGLGEAAPNVRYAEDAASVLRTLGTLAPMLGDDPALLDDILDRIDAAAPQAPAARAAVDIALHDWAGRRAGEPLWRRFGADPAAVPPTSFSIGLDTPAAMRDKVREADGFAVLKIKVGLRDDRAVLEAIRSVTDRPLYVDANEGWTDPRAAADLIRWMRGLGVVLVEQPLPAADRDGARRLRDAVDVPILADEAALTAADVPALADAYDGVNVKVQKCGGLRAARRMIDAARDFGLKVMVGCMVETSIGITAAAHLAPLADWVDLDGNLLLAADPFCGAAVRDGRVVPPDLPGLGVEGTFPEEGA